MREEGLLCQIRRRFVPTTDSAHSSKRYPKIVKDTEMDGLDEIWIADITYIRLPTNFWYLATILDAFSRYCVGWSLSRFIDTQLTLSALEMALVSRRSAVGLIHHSDQGVQYASSEYIARLEGVGAQISMTSVGNPYENAKAESFFRTLKKGEVCLKDYGNFEEAEGPIVEFIEEVYNRDGKAFASSIDAYGTRLLAEALSLPACCRTVSSKAGVSQVTPKWNTLVFREARGGGGRRAAVWAPLLGRRPPKAISRLTFWPEVVSSASAFTFTSRLSLNLLMPCRSFASAKSGSTHIRFFRRAFS